MWLDKISMAKKLVIAPGVLIIILLGVTITSSALLDGLSSDMERISFDLAPDTELAAEMTDTVYSLRMAMKNYVQTSEQKYVNNFLSHAKDWNERLMPKAYDSIQDKRRIELLNEIDKLRDDYITTFETGVVKNMRIRNTLVDVMNARGPIIEKNLTDIVDFSANSNIGVALHAGKAARNLIRARLHVMKFLVDNTPEQVKNYTEELNITKNELSQLINELLPAQKKVANSTLELIAEYQSASKQVSDAIYKRNESIKQLDAIGPQIAQHINELRKSISNSMEDAAKEAQADTDSATLSLFIVSTIAAAIGVLVTFLIARAVATKLKATNAVLADIANGDGDLTIRIPANGSDELAQIAGNYNTFANKLKSTVAELSSASQSMLASSQTLSDKAVITQQEITEQQGQAEQAASAMTEMAASAQEINYSATEAEELAHSTSAAATQGATVISEASDAMQTLSNQIQGASLTVEELKDDSDKIGQVLNVIISIAEQTNLLALNAAIEAARAGEQGRGFAVVADEVRSLASRTQDSTEEIKVIIDSLQKSSEEANKAMLVSRENADQTVAKVESANESLSAIDSYISQIASAISQISTAAGEQATVSSEVSERVTSMSDISTKTLSESKETTISAEELKAVGQNINRLLQQFKI